MRIDNFDVFYKYPPKFPLQPVNKYTFNFSRWGIYLDGAEDKKLQNLITNLNIDVKYQLDVK